MRNYPQDSPRAAARIVAMAALADGHLCTSEVRRLENLGHVAALGLRGDEWQCVLQEYCEDRLLCEAVGWSPLPPDAATLAAILDEVRNPALRDTVMRLCAAVASADAHSADAESVVSRAAVTCWGMKRAAVGAA